MSGLPITIATFSSTHNYSAIPRLFVEYSESFEVSNKIEHYWVPSGLDFDHPPINSEERLLLVPSGPNESHVDSI